MGRHRRSKVVLGARSTVVKAAAAMGVATALAVGINSAANGPTNALATADPNGDPVNLAGSSLPETGHSATTQTQQQQSGPTGFATESAGQPKLIQQISASQTTHRVTTALDQQTPAALPSPSASQPSTPSQPSDPGTASTAPSSAPTTPQTPPPSQGGSGHHQGGGLLGGVVGTVGGVVDGLLG